MLKIRFGLKFVLVGLLAAPSAFAQARGQGPVAPTQQPMPPGMVMPGGPTGGNAANPEGAPADSTDPKDLLERLKAAEQRIKDLESSTVLSEPETRVKRKEVYVDANGNVHDEPVPGAKKKVTYERERVYRRQTISEKIDDALSGEAESRVQVGVDASIVAQFLRRTNGAAPTFADNHAYELASADLFFTANVAQHTMFFADIVGLSGTHPNMELDPMGGPALINGATLINGYAARLQFQNQINLREAWLRTELFSQRLAITAGRLDLTNTFDHNAAANDETTQFLSDALVNNPMLGLSTNGAGVAVVFDPKHGFNFKIGLQQSDDTTATSLSNSIFSLAEVGYVARLPGLGQGGYRVWYRADNSAGPTMIGYGLSLDQRLAPGVTFFGRYGAQQAVVSRDHFYSGGFQFSDGLGFFPDDVWGIGYAQIDPQDLTSTDKQRVTEGYYNFALTEKLKLSFHVQHVLALQAGTKLGYLVPGVRLQASF